jgi:protein SCO1/2
VKRLLAALLGLALFATSAGCTAAAPKLHGNPYTNPAQAPNVALPSTTGEEFDLNDHRGQVILLYFGYTSCPDICPATLAQLRSILTAPEIDRNRVKVVMITVDPARDTLAVLKEYMVRFDPDFIGLRAEGDLLAAVEAEYGVYAARDESSDPEHYIVSHTARVFVIDPEGVLITNYSFDTPSADIQADLEWLSRER